MDDKEGQASGPGATGGPVLPPEGPREKLIDTAIKFLQNPKVRESDFAQRRAFLEKKGLTKEEIDIAVERSGTAGDQNRVPVATATSQPTVPGQYGAAVQPVTVPPPASAWSRLRDYIATAIVVGGVGYAAYKLYKKYLEPFLLGPSKEEQTLQSLQKSMLEIQQSLPEILTTLKDLQTSVAQQQGNVQEVLYSSKVAASNERLRDSQYSNELKEEIKSLKGLLLSRKQFPSTPVTKPVIPSWQLESASQSFDSTTETSIPSKSDGLTSSTAHVTFSTAHGNTNTEVTEVPLGLESSPPGGVSLTEADGKPASEPAAEPVAAEASDVHEPQINGEKEESAHLNGDLELDHQDQEVQENDLQQVKGQVDSNTDQPKLDIVQQEQ